VGIDLSFAAAAASGLLGFSRFIPILVRMALLTEAYPPVPSYRNDKPEHDIGSVGWSRDLPSGLSAS
jgi:hypothetical protein